MVTDLIVGEVHIFQHKLAVLVAGAHKLPNIVDVDAVPTQVEGLELLVLGEPFADAPHDFFGDVTSCQAKAL